MKYWFLLIAGQNPNYPTSYSRQLAAPSCPGNSKICAILTEEDVNGLPIITDELKEEMVTALQFGVESTNVLLRTTA